MPDQAAVTGFDDIVLARHLNPPLTTVHVDAFGLGQRAVERLLVRQRAPAILGRHRELIRTTLAVRVSCGAARDARDPEPPLRLRGRLTPERAAPIVSSGRMPRWLGAAALLLALACAPGCRPNAVRAESAGHASAESGAHASVTPGAQPAAEARRSSIRSSAAPSISSGS